MRPESVILRLLERDTVRFEIEMRGDDYAMVRLQIRKQFFGLTWWRTYYESSTRTLPLEEGQSLHSWIEERRLYLLDRMETYLCRAAIA